MGLIQEGGVAATAKFFLAAAKPCDYCNSAAAMLFCRAESAFMCAACDEEAHRDSNNEHERVWMCEVCEQAPAAVTCKADAAALCVSCDRDIHSANLLAGRHDRVPVVPFAESAVVKSAADFLTPHDSGGDARSFLLPDRNLETTENRYILDPWIPVSPSTTPNKLPADLKSMELFFQDSDQFLDLDNYQIASYGDSAVPVQSTIKPSHVPIHGQNSSENRFVIDFTGSNVSGYTTPSLSRQSVSSSLMDVGVVPEGSSPSEISYHFTGDVNSSVDLSRNQVSQVVGMDREARVLRYREKRRKRKFEKTIRYASRKAYAESRPRIKGRFAKRTDAESDLDRSFSGGAANFVADPRYGVNQTVFM